MENKQIDSKKLGKYFIDKMLDNTVNIFKQNNVEGKDIDKAFEENNQLAGTMTLVNLKAFVTFTNYSKELNKVAIKYYNNKIDDYYNNNGTHANFENFVDSCHKLHNEINNFISAK